MTATTTQPDMREAATWYAKRGWPVFPVGSHKRPLVKNGFKDASTDEKQIGAWWSQHPDAGIGIPTGPDTFCAIDIDPRNGGEDGFDSLIAANGPMPETVEVLTGGGGRHLWYECPAGLGCSTEKLAPGVDVKAAGGYVVVPPSLHASGNRYAFELSSGPDQVSLAALPKWVVEKLAPRPAARTNDTQHEPFEPDRVRDALQHVDGVDEYDRWIEVGMALHAGLGDAGRELWDTWSQKSAKYDETTQDAKWRSFKPGGGVGIGTVFAHAKAGGWRPARSSNGRRRAASDPDREEEAARVEEQNGIDENAIADAGKLAAAQFREGYGYDAVLDHVALQHGSKLRHDTLVASVRAEWAEAVPDPIPLPKPDDLSPVPEFPVDALPLGVRAWITDIARRMGCPVDFVASADLAARSSLATRTYRMRPKRHDSWLVAPIVWGAAVGRPSTKKTNALKEPLVFIEEAEADAAEDNAERRREHEHRLAVTKKAREVSDRKMRKRLQDGATVEAICQDKSLRIDDPEPPRITRYVVNDATIEALEVVLADNECILQFRDELAGWIRGLERSGQESARAFHLECWTGQGMRSSDRIRRGHTRSHAAEVVLGGIQPDRIRNLLVEDALGGGDDGMLQRFQALVWPDHRAPDVVDAQPDHAAMQQAREVYRMLVHLKADGTAPRLQPEQLGARRGKDGLWIIGFTNDAQTQFTAWLQGLNRRLAGNHGMLPALEAHLGKYASFVPTLALLDWLASGAIGGGVGVDSLERALRLADYFEAHAIRLYGCADSTRADAEAVLAWAEARLRRPDSPDEFTARDVARGVFRSDRTATRRAKAALDELTNSFIVIPSNRPTTVKGGAPTTVYRLSPKWGPGA